MSILSILNSNGIVFSAETLDENHRLPQEYSYEYGSGCSVFNGPSAKYKITLANKYIERSFFFCISSSFCKGDMSVECFDGFVDLFFEQKIFHLACATSYNINVGQNSYTAYRYGHESLRGAWGWSMSAELRSEACERLKQDFLNIKDVLGDLTDDVLIFLSNQDVPRIKRAIASLDDCPGEAIFNLTQDPDASISSIAKEHKRLKEMSAFI